MSPNAISEGTSCFVVLVAMQESTRAIGGTVIAIFQVVRERPVLPFTFANDWLTNANSMNSRSCVGLGKTLSINLTPQGSRLIWNEINLLFLVHH